MNEVQTLELPEEIHRRLVNAAKALEVSPAEWIAAMTSSCPAHGFVVAPEILDLLLTSPDRHTRPCS